jgi:hypothetical protein
MARSGLNTSLSYQYGGKTYKFSVRASQVAHGSQLVSDEAQARTRRAYYPHQVTAIPFALTVIIKGYKERVQFSNFLSDYVSRALDPSLSVSNFPTMLVTMPNRKFIRWGVPLNGIEWGNHVGSMIWTPTVSFETHVDQSLGQSTTDYRWISYFSMSAQSVSASPEIKYFYPSGIQLSGSQVPDVGAFDKVTSIQDIQNIVNGGTAGGSDIGDVDPVTGVNPINNGTQQ